MGAPARGALYGNVVLFWWIFIVCASLLALHLRIFIVFGGGAWKSIKTGNSNNLGMREALSCRTCILLFYTFFCGSRSRIHFFYVETKPAHLKLVEPSVASFSFVCSVCRRGRACPCQYYLFAYWLLIKQEGPIGWFWHICAP